MSFLSDMRDVRFTLYDVLKVGELCEQKPYADFDVSDFNDLLDAARDCASNVLYPLHEQGDRLGLSFEDGKVTLPPGWKEAYETYVEMGWNGLAIAEEHGGQGAPMVVHAATQDLFISANGSFCFTPGLTVGALNLINSFGSDEQKAIYQEKMLEGTWSGTMCLTEAGAGTAVPDLLTSARPIEGQPGKYKIKGQKIFISAGDQDLTENIVHMVLARVEGDPTGSKGVSLFIVPKLRPEGDGLVPNDVTTVGCEEKMGIHACPTCTLSFGEEDDCVGWLIGGQGRGLRCMFQMMNEARIAVGAQGMGTASIAYLKAKAYAEERIQGTKLEDLKDPDAPRVKIIEHPDVKRMLMHMKAVAEGCRALVYYAAYCHDREQAASNDADKQRWEYQLEVLTPIVKAWCSDEAFRATELGIQVHGGYGYIKEYGLEQLARDVKIASLYEGTNGVQALDLLGRKISRKGGAMLMTLLGELGQFVSGPAKDGPLAKAVAALQEAQDLIPRVAFGFAQSNMTGDVAYPALHACSLLQIMGDVLVGWRLLVAGVEARKRLDGYLAEKGLADKSHAEQCEDPEARFLHGKVAVARFFCFQILPRTHARFQSILSEDRSALDMVF